MSDHQLSLLPDALTPEARARQSDPATSHEAASKHTRTGKATAHAERVLAALRETPWMTAAETGKATGLGHVESQRRLSDLCRCGRVRKGPARTCRVKGSRMLTWKAEL